MGGTNAQDPQGWKRPWGLWSGGLRLKEQKGPRHAPPPLVSEGMGPHLGTQQAPRARVGGAITLGSSLLLLDGPSHLPLLISLASLLCPQDPRSLDGALTLFPESPSACLS